MFTLVNKTVYANNGSTGAGTVTLINPVTTGNLVVVVMGCVFYGGGIHSGNPSLSNGQTLILNANAPNITDYCDMFSWYCIATSPISSMSFTFPFSATPSFIVYEYSFTPPLGQLSGAFNHSYPTKETAWAFPLISGFAGTSNLFLGLAASDQFLGQISTLSSPFTADVFSVKSSSGPGTNQCLVASYVGLGTYTPSFAISPSDYVDSVIFGFYEIPSAGGQVATSTSISSSENPSSLGDTVTFTATVNGPGGSGSPTGTISFTIDGIVVAIQTASAVSTGVSNATYSTSSLLVGLHTVVATYSGDTNYLASFSSPLIQEVDLSGGCTPPVTPYNLNYIKSFALSNGKQYTLALDAGGNLWQENVVTLPFVMTPLTLVGPTSTQILPGSYMLSTTLDDVEYMCFSNLSYGTDIPRQYNPQPAQGAFTLDRISQVGPGAPPTFQATAGTAGSQAAITSWAGVGNVVTFQAVNSFTAGELIKLSGFHTSTFFNGLILSVLGTGLSGTQFEVLFVGYSGGSDHGLATPQFGYPISGITQNIAQSDPNNPGHFRALLWSDGVGTKGNGNVLTVYYKEAGAVDPILQAALNAGQAVYVYISTAPFGNGTYLVTSSGSGTPPGDSHQSCYFTCQMPSNNFQYIEASPFGQYQMTVATVTLFSPIPNLSVGDSVVISGVNPGGWDATWAVTVTLFSGVYAITQTQMTAGNGIYTWSWAGVGTPVAPGTGNLVTVIQTLNGNGIFNVTDAAISSVTGGPSSGTFTINSLGPSQNIAPAAEAGQAQTAGTAFQIDPGQVDVGTTQSPIFGNAFAGAGIVTIAGSTTAIGAGTRQAVVFFETRNGLKTACSAPITFTTDSTSTYIIASNIPLGPPDVIRRWIAFTGAGANGIPGPNFYTIDTPVTYTLNNQTFLYTATFIDNNQLTTAKFTFTDAVLLAGDEIDVQGNNLFAEIELGSSAWNIAYAGRMFYGLEQNKVLNFNNLSFDGGYLPILAGNLSPLGWGIDAASNSNAGTPANITAFQITSNVVTFQAVNSYISGQQVVISGLAVGTYLNDQELTVLSAGLSASQFEASFTHANVGLTSDTGLATPVNQGATLNVSPVFGLSYYIKNLLGSQQSTLGMIIQNAYQDAYNVPIILPNTLYSVRVTARIPSGKTVGNLVVDLTEANVGFVSGTGGSPYGVTFGAFSLPFSSMSTSMAIYTGTMLTTPFTTGVPKGLVLRLFAQNIGYTDDVEIDRIEIFPTNTPTLTTNIRASYIDNFEAFDANTGNIGLASHNTQPCFGAFELHDQLYFLQSSSMQSTQDVPGVEPSGPGGGWAVHEVSNRVGTCGIHAYDYGEEWVVTACRNGLYGFNGGQPIRIDFQQKEVWESINWKYGNTIVVRNDLPNRRITAAVPLPTPNRWLPLAPVNSNPTSPNVVMMWNYQGLDTFEELVSGRAMHTTMFGTLASVDMRVKCSLWQITTPYMGFITQPDLTSQSLLVCNGVGNEKIYRFDENALSDDGVAINSIYCTWGFVNSAKAAQYPLLGFERKLFTQVQQLISGFGVANITAYPNYILTPSTLALNPAAYTVPGLTGSVVLQETPPDDIWRPLNISGNRVFLQYSSNAVGSAFKLSKAILIGVIHPFSTVNPNSG